MNIYRVTRTDDDAGRYETFTDFICVAPDEATARKIAPHEIDVMTLAYDQVEYMDTPNVWVYGWIEADKLDTLKVELVGVANESYDKIQILCASYHAG